MKGCGESFISEGYVFLRFKFPTVRIFNSFDEVDKINSPVLTIGTFDGVHIGHQKIIEQLKKEALKLGGESVLFTFYPHPRMVLFPDAHGLQLLTTQEEKLKLLEVFGIDNVIVQPFTFDFSRLTALEFVRDYLVNKLHVKKLIIGYDHQFGKNREGSIDFLRTLADVYEFEVIEIPAQDIDDVNVSSTKIREALKSGDVETASNYLGRPYSLTGKVVHGKELGRTIGFPTANIYVSDDTKLIPANGVYAARVIVGTAFFNGMLNIGNRPTVSTTVDRSIEVHIFDFDSLIYDAKITIEFIRFVRQEKEFSSIDALRYQLQEDEQAIRAFFNTTFNF